MLLGIISDTHGLLRPEVFAHFAGVEHILHAGDIGPVELLAELEAIAPVTAVWGNTDGWDVRGRVPEIARVELAGVPVVVLHGQQFGAPTPEKVAAAYTEAGLVVFGHSHRPVIRWVGSTLVINPGGAGAARFGLTPSITLAEVIDGKVSAHLVPLK